jgi:hypothetical protein
MVSGWPGGSNSKRMWTVIAAWLARVSCQQPERHPQFAALTGVISASYFLLGCFLCLTVQAVHKPTSVHKV